MDQYTIRPNRTVVTSFVTHSTPSASSSYDDGNYVLHVTNTKPQSTKQLLSCALSNQSVLTYDRETLKKVHSIENCHHQAISDLTFTQIQNTPMVVTSSLDGTVKIFDLRANPILNEKGVAQAAFVMKVPDHQALSVSIGYNGNLSAVGSSKGHVHFFDLRNISSAPQIGMNDDVTTPLGTYVDAHTEEVTRVRFQNVVGSNGYDTTPLLVTAGEDGLACIHDTSQPSEEAALRSVLNVQSPLRDINFFGPSLEGIYCLTGSETMSVWHHDSAQRMSDYGDIRNMLSTNAGIEINYLVGCHWDGSELNLIAGNTQGDCAMFQVEANSISVKRLLKGGHKSSCIRDFVVSPLDRSIVTAGEDSRLCEWKLIKPINTTPNLNVRASYSSEKESINPKEGGGRIKKQKSKKSHAPY